ncbi:MAG: DNA gyrase inhibitor YacG [Planctomycetota bacterium]
MSQPSNDYEPPVIEAACRTCGGTITSEVRTFPFCSERCRGADLGKWFNEEYRISREIKDSDIETVD